MDSHHWLLVDLLGSSELIPYAIIASNLLIFKLLRSSVNIIFYYMIEKSHRKKGHKKAQKGTRGRAKLVKLFLDELLSTCELCVDCAELNVVYEKHGPLAYGVCLFLLTYLWIEAFGDAHTTPGYLAEDYFLADGNDLLTDGNLYTRIGGQSLAIPIAWRLASIYWKYELLSEHSAMLDSENCRTSLGTSILNGFLVEFGCCFICRMVELIGGKLLERRRTTKRTVDMSVSFMSTLLVVLALDWSGGYFNPILASSLEYGCKGITFQSHLLVFWLGPLLAHVLAKGTFKKLTEAGSAEGPRKQTVQDKASKRLTRSSSHKC